MSVLADASIWIAAFRRRDEAFFESVEDGEVAVCAPVALELMAGAANPELVRGWRRVLDNSPTVAVDAAVSTRAEDVVELLSRQAGGRHRGMPVADLLIAACAETAGLTLVHADGHFARIAAVTGQEHRQVAV